MQTAHETEAEHKRLLGYSSTVANAKKSILKELVFSGHFKEYLRILEVYAVFHDLRKEGQMRGNFFSHQILKEYCRRKHLDFELARNALPEEMQQLMLTGKIDAEKLKKRVKEVLVIVTRHSRKEIFGKEAYDVKEKETKEDIDELVSELQGLCANPGKVIGAVKVCNDVKEANKKIKPGDILVTGMTMPEFVPVMTKAGAIITDEGGITCHAAIISRELGKPCIVGIKIATKVLKDNDIVEVNANHGVVIMKRDFINVKRPQCTQQVRKMK